MAARDRGKKPRAPKGKLREPPEPSNHDDETPKFCLHYLCRDFDVQALGPDGQAAFAKTLQKLASSQWKELITSPRHGQGTEFIPSRQIRAPVPPRFQDADRFLIFRYFGKLPMAGVRVRDV